MRYFLLMTVAVMLASCAQKTDNENKEAASEGMVEQVVIPQEIAATHSEFLITTAEKAFGGDAESQEALGWCYFTGKEGLAKDVTKALDLWEKAAAHGNLHAQSDLGHVYYFGESVPRDISKGLNWLNKAAENGSARACYTLGAAYHDGVNVPKDLAKSYQFMMKAADLGDAEAMYVIGVFYFEGTYVQQDAAESYKWLQRAADKGSAKARKMLNSL